jgi:2-iminoacetate synthase ThiH
MTSEQAMKMLIELMQENRDVLFKLKNNILTKEEKCDTISIEREVRNMKCYLCPSACGCGYCSFATSDEHCGMYDIGESPIDDHCPSFYGMDEEEIKSYDIDVKTS